MALVPRVESGVSVLSAQCARSHSSLFLALIHLAEGTPDTETWLLFAFPFHHAIQLFAPHHLLYLVV